MAAPSYMRSPFSLAKRLKVAPPSRPSQVRTVYQSRQPWHTMMPKSLALERAREEDPETDDILHDAAEEARGVTLPIRQYTLPPSVQSEVDGLRLPRSVQLAYLAPLRRKPTHGIPTADLQLRSYSVRNLEFMADFAMRAAYYMNLAARGPVPLPRITERWTVPKSNFVHKKSQENFERVTLRRLVQIQDGHPETVQIWLGFLQKYLYYGVGMKANVWEHTGIDVGKDMDAEAERVQERVQERLKLFGRRKDLVGNRETARHINDSLFKGQWGSLGTMGSSQYSNL